MSNAKRVGLGLLGLLILALVVVLLWPAPDPLADAQTVYVQLAGVDARGGRSEVQTGLDIVLDDRNLTLVSDRATADVALEIRDVRVNLADVEISLTEGQVQGRVIAECEVTDLRTGRQYTMDLTVSFANDTVRAGLRGRRFWEFWK
ncbi:MAG: hypothetical protein JSW65_07405 [Candidatus Bipolaricaulota bacterium]|nr:MAG: hypothetical protein JSW65_07405 [Candidatus Bipolaricaulota bacterium]